MIWQDSFGSFNDGGGKALTQMAAKQNPIYDYIYLNGTIVAKVKYPVGSVPSIVGLLLDGEHSRPFDFSVYVPVLTYLVLN